MTFLVVGPLMVAIICAGVCWRTTWMHRPKTVSLMLGLMLVSTAAAAVLASVMTVGAVGGGVVSTLCVVLAALGGAPLVERVLRSASRIDAGPIDDDTPLAGGLWIGVAERISVAVALMVGWPEGLLLVTAVKGVGRYPELSSAGGGQHYAEKFIIGSFFSLLWACGCAGIAYVAIR